MGGGKVGTALARQLSEEDHNVTIVDTNKARVEHLTESYDVLGIVGNGSSITTLAEAGIEDADVFIAVTGSDELNLLCCMFAKKAGHCHAIARVRNPSYSHELDFIKKQIGLSAIINPEMAEMCIRDRPDTVSNMASTGLGMQPVSTKGMAPMILMTTQLRAVVAKPSRIDVYKRQV